MKVKQLEFEGNRAISSKKIKGEIPTLTVPGSFVTSSLLEANIRAIKGLFRKNGFVDPKVRVRVERAKYLRDNSAALSAAIIGKIPARGLSVIFQIDEGPKDTISKIGFELNDRTITNKILFNALQLKIGSHFTEKRMKIATSKIKRFYNRRGYSNAEVEFDITFPEKKPTQKSIIFKIEPHKIRRFGQIIVRGNVRTKTWIIRKELRFREGKIFTASEMENGQQRLRTAGLFQNVQITPVDLEESDSIPVNILVIVQERNRIELELGGTYSHENGLFMEGRAIWRNLFGVGLLAELHGQLGIFGDEYKGLELKLSTPTWLTWGLTTDFNAYYRQQSKERFGILTSQGVTFAVSRQGTSGMWRGWRGSILWELRRRNRDEDLVRLPGPNDDLTEQPVATRTGAIGPQLTIDRRTDISGQLNTVAPARGYYAQARVLFASPELGGNNTFLTIGFIGQSIWPLSKRLRLTNTVRYDHGIPIPFGEDSLLPEVERFFAGGDTTVRGFAEDYLATEVIKDPLAPLGNITRYRILPVGGNIRFIYNLDLQVILATTSWGGFKFDIASALFLDTGLIRNSLKGIKLRHLRHAIGIALARLRLNPFGELSLEWAIPLDPETGDDPLGRIHLNAGILF